MKAPRVLVFTPIYEDKDYCFERFLENTKKLSYPNYHHIIIDNSKTGNYARKLRRKYGLRNVVHVERGNNSREALARAQNFARNIALKDGYDYLFSLESDIFVPHDIIQRLILHGKYAISGLYMIGDRSKGQRVPCITVPQYHEYLGAYGTRLLKPEEWEDYYNKGVKQVQAAGMGCCLISKYIFRDIPFMYDPRYQGHSDIYFFNKMFEKRIPVFVDTDIYCEHENINWSTVKDR